jgi:hypothetical protein
MVIPGRYALKLEAASGVGGYKLVIHVIPQTAIGDQRYPDRSHGLPPTDDAAFHSTGTGADNNFDGPGSESTMWRPPFRTSYAYPIDFM